MLDEDTDPDFHHTVYLLGGNTLFGLHQHGTPAPEEPFSEHRVGLDHVSFRLRRPGGAGEVGAGWTGWGSPTARSRTPATARA